MNDELLEAYLKTLYFVDGFRDAIQIGKGSEEADTFCMDRGFSGWAFITAWNPLSVSLSAAENRIRNNELYADLESYVVLTGRGQDPEGIWGAEESFFVAGIESKEAIALGRKYGQRAIVTGVIRNEAKLVEILDAGGAERLPQVFS